MLENKKIKIRDLRVKLENICRDDKKSNGTRSSAIPKIPGGWGKVYQKGIFLCTFL